MNERLKKEEEERIARRKRVEAIMLRTRGKGSTPSNTPTKVLIIIITIIIIVVISTIVNVLIITLQHLFVIEGLLQYCISSLTLLDN